MPKEAEKQIISSTGLNLSSKDKKELAETLYQEIKESIGDASDLFTKNDKWDRLYELKTDRKAKKKKSNIHIPMPAIKVDGITDKMIEIISEPEHTFSIHADKFAEKETKLEAIRIWFQDLLDEDVKFKSRAEEITLNAVKHGMSPVSLLFESRKKRRTKITVYQSEEEFKEQYTSAQEAGIPEDEYNSYLREIKDLGRTRIEERYNYYEEGAEIDVIERNDFVRIPFKARTHEEASGEFKRVWLTWQQLLKGVKEEKYSKKDIESLKNKIKLNDSEKLSGEENEKSNPFGSKGLECYTGWYTYKIKDPEDEMEIAVKTLITMAFKEKHILKVDEYIYWSDESFFHYNRIKKKPNSAEGYSVLAILNMLSQQLDTMYNQLNDYWNMVLKPVFLKKQGVRIIPDPGTREIEFGTTYEIDDPNPEKVLQMLFKSIPHAPNVITEIQQITNYIDDASKHSSLLSGRESPTDPRAPASKAMLKAQMSLGGIASYLRTIREGFNSIGEGLMWLMYQFGDDEYTVKVGEEDVTFTREDIFPEDFSIELAVSDKRLSQDIQKQEADYILERLSAFMAPTPLNPQGNPIGQQELIRNFLSKYQYDGDRKVIEMTREDLIGLLTQEMQRQQAQQQAQQLQEGIQQASEGLTPEEIEEAKQNAIQGQLNAAG